MSHLDKFKNDNIEVKVIQDTFLNVEWMINNLKNIKNNSNNFNKLLKSVKEDNLEEIEYYKKLVDANYEKTEDDYNNIINNLTSLFLNVLILKKYK